MVTTSQIPGCCNGKNFYNLGGAHSHKSAKDQDEFDNRIFSLGSYPLNIAITNSGQTKTREFLDAQGWKYQDVTPSLRLHFISGKDFREAHSRSINRKRLQEKKKEELRLIEEREFFKKNNPNEVTFHMVSTAMSGAPGSDRSKTERIERLKGLEKSFGVKFPRSYGYYRYDERVFYSLKSLVSNKRRKG